MFKILVGLALSCAAAIAADDYELRMDRPAKAGERTSVIGSSQSKQSMQVKVDGKLVKDDNVETTVEYEVEREILAVNEAGKATHNRVKVVKISGNHKGAPITQLKAGDVIETKTEAAKNAALVNGQPATAEQGQIAQLLPKAAGRGTIKDDDAFGPGRRIKVGEEWPINSAVAAKQGIESGMPGITPEGIKGNMKLIELTNREGQPCLKVQGRVNVTGTGMGVPGAPPEMKVNEMSAEVTMEGDFPVDPLTIVPRTHAEMKMRMVAAGEVEKNGMKLRLEANAVMTRSEKTQVKRIE